MTVHYSIGPAAALFTLLMVGSLRERTWYKLSSTSDWRSFSCFSGSLDARDLAASTGVQTSLFSQSCLTNLCFETCFLHSGDHTGFIIVG